MRSVYLWILLVLPLPVLGAELSLNFDDVPLDEQPPGFTNVLYGKGRPGEWKIIMDEVPPLIAPATSQSPSVTKRPVLAQLSRNPTDERFPLLLYDKDTFGDFTLTTRFKIVDGLIEQLAGIVFRVQNETNFYVVRANAQDNTLRYYKVVDGLRTPLIGPRVNISRDVWYELKITCTGNRIQAWLNGNAATLDITDNSFQVGKVGFWTKSDAISYFSGMQISYTPRESLAHVLVRTTMDKNPRLRGLKIAMLDKNGEPRIEASKDEAEIGTAGSDSDKETIAKGTIFFGKDKDTITIKMPLRDRNGEPIAAVSFTMKSFAGQTQNNAIIRATPMVKEMQKQVQTLQDFTR